MKIQRILNMMAMVAIMTTFGCMSDGFRNGEDLVNQSGIAYGGYTVTHNAPIKVYASKSSTGTPILVGETTSGTLGYPYQGSTFYRYTGTVDYIPNDAIDFSGSTPKTTVWAENDSYHPSSDYRKMRTFDEGMNWLGCFAEHSTWQDRETFCVSEDSPFVTSEVSNATEEECVLPPDNVPECVPGTTTHQSSACGATDCTVNEDRSCVLGTCHSGGCPRLGARHNEPGHKYHGKCLSVQPDGSHFPNGYLSDRKIGIMCEFDNPIPVACVPRHKLDKSDYQ